MRPTAEMARRCPNFRGRTMSGDGRELRRSIHGKTMRMCHHGLNFLRWSHRPRGFRESLQAQPCFLGTESGKSRTEDPRGGLWYDAPQLRPSIGRIIRLPDRVGRNGSAPQFFAEVSACFNNIWGFHQSGATSSTMWMASTWVSDVVPSPPALIVRTTHAPCRRSVPTACMWLSPRSGSNRNQPRGSCWLANGPQSVPC